MILELLLLWSLKCGMVGDFDMIETPKQYANLELGFSFDGADYFIAFADAQGILPIGEINKLNIGFKIGIDTDYFDFGGTYTYDFITAYNSVDIWFKIGNR